MLSQRPGQPWACRGIARLPSTCAFYRAESAVTPATRAAETPSPAGRAGVPIEVVCLRCAARSPAPSASKAKDRKKHTSELQSHLNLVCRLLLEKKKHQK